MISEYTQPSWACRKNAFIHLILLAYIHHDPLFLKPTKAMNPIQFTAIIQSPIAKVYPLKHHYYSPNKFIDENPVL